MHTEGYFTKSAFAYQFDEFVEFKGGRRQLVLLGDVVLDAPGLDRPLAVEVVGARVGEAELRQLAVEQLLDRLTGATALAGACCCRLSRRSPR